jgi:hypothetical protein
MGMALYYASKKGHTSIVELLFQSQINISAYHASRALRRAVKNRHTSIVELLLERGIDISADHVGRQPKLDTPGLLNAHQNTDTLPSSNLFSCYLLIMLTSSVINGIFNKLRQAKYESFTSLLQLKTIPIPFNHK